ncbi:MAG TPA: hypothetical protein VE442_20510, partial [Jatrophihabitans sp.]|nr:hypothetical protein [Jatrophihabitans sp.]
MLARNRRRHWTLIGVVGACVTLVAACGSQVDPKDFVNANGVVVANGSGAPGGFVDPSNGNVIAPGSGGGATVPGAGGSGGGSGSAGGGGTGGGTGGSGGTGGGGTGGGGGSGGGVATGP